MSLRAVIWCAVSTKAQTDDEKDSLPSQETKARELAEHNGWIVVAVLRVPGHSRRYVDIHECARDMALEGIDAFNQLLDLWEQKAFDVLIVRDGDRFARTQSLHAYVVERTIGIGARIYSLADGWVDERNYRMFISMSGYNAAHAIDALVEHHHRAMDGVARRGLPIGPSPLMSHTIIRDPKNGRALRLEVDESKRRLWDDLATLLLEGTPWQNIEIELYERFGHVNSETGQRYSTSAMYKVLHNPYFWGHSGRYYKNKNGPWIYDADEPPPPGVEIHYNTVPPVYTGELAESVKAELRRRYIAMRGRARPQATYRFTGLLMCGSCRCMLSVYRDKRIRKDGSRYMAWLCYSRWTPYPRSERCDQSRMISDIKVEQYVNSLLQNLIASGQSDVKLLFAGNSEQLSNESQLSALEYEIAEVERSVGEMVIQQANAPKVTQHIYTAKIGEAAERLEILRNARKRILNATNSPSIIAARDRAFDTLLHIGLKAFWLQEPTKVNQLLHALFGKYRLVVEQAEITGIDIATRWF
jgi:DNA invertase Pin-like site-specific DNA recombinase